MAWAKPKASTTARGYGNEHMKARRAALARYTPGSPCCLCGRPLPADTSLIALDHTPDRTGYRGLAHLTCNRVDGSRRGRARQHPNPPPTRTSRPW